MAAAPSNVATLTGDDGAADAEEANVVTAATDGAAGDEAGAADEGAADEGAADDGAADDDPQTSSVQILASELNGQ